MGSEELTFASTDSLTHDSIVLMESGVCCEDKLNQSLQSAASTLHSLEIEGIRLKEDETILKEKFLNSNGNGEAKSNLCTYQSHQKSLHHVQKKLLEIEQKSRILSQQNEDLRELIADLSLAFGPSASEFNEILDFISHTNFKLALECNRKTKLEETRQELLEKIKVVRLGCEEYSLELQKEFIIIMNHCNEYEHTIKTIQESITEIEEKKRSASLLPALRAETTKQKQHIITIEKSIRQAKNKQRKLEEEIDNLRKEQKVVQNEAKKELEAIKEERKTSQEKNRKEISGAKATLRELVQKNKKLKKRRKHLTSRLSHPEAPKLPNELQKRIEESRKEQQRQDENSSEKLEMFRQMIQDDKDIIESEEKMITTLLAQLKRQKEELESEYSATADQEIKDIAAYIAGMEVEQQRKEEEYNKLENERLCKEKVRKRGDALLRKAKKTCRKQAKKKKAQTLRRSIPGQCPELVESSQTKCEYFALNALEVEPISCEDDIEPYYDSSPSLLRSSTDEPWTTVSNTNAFHPKPLAICSDRVLFATQSKFSLLSVQEDEAYESSPEQERAITKRNKRKTKKEILGANGSKCTTARWIISFRNVLLFLSLLVLPSILQIYL